jgi:hypothetical protein
LLPVAAASATSTDHGPDELDLRSTETTRVIWQGPVEIDGRLWPVQNNQFVLAPAGKHRLSPGLNRPPITIADFNGEIQSALVSEGRVDLAYASRSRALAILGSPISSIDLDGMPFARPSGDDAATVMLPAGQHLVTFNR